MIGLRVPAASPSPTNRLPRSRRAGSPVISMSVRFSGGNIRRGLGMERPSNILVVAEYNPSFPPHRKTDEALQHSAEYLGMHINHRWLSTVDITLAQLGEADGLWMAPGSPYRSVAGALTAIRFAREGTIPLLATCGGFQHVILEYARNVLGFDDAQHAEYDPYASRLFISELSCSLVGRIMRLTLKARSHVAALYGSTTASEQYYPQP